jgi:hypothetical protein
MERTVELPDIEITGELAINLLRIDAEFATIQLVLLDSNARPIVKFGEQVVQAGDSLKVWGGKMTIKREAFG